MDPTLQFIAELEAFLERSGMSPTAFGISALKDPRFVGDLRAGREPRWRTLERARAFIRQRDAEREEAAA